MDGDAGCCRGSQGKANLVGCRFDAEPVYVGHPFIERAVVPEVFFAATEAGVPALDRVACPFVLFDDTAGVVGARPFASHFVEAIPMLGVFVVEALHEEAGVEVGTAVAGVVHAA